MPAIYKGEDVRIEVKLPKAFSIYTEVKGHVIFPDSTGTFQIIVNAQNGATLDATSGTNSMPVAVFIISKSITSVADDATNPAKILSNSMGVLEVRLKEGTLFDILTVPIGPVIDTKIKSIP